MKKILLITILLSLFIPALFSEVTYLTEEEYKDLSKAERQNYNQNLEEQLADYQQRKSDAISKTNRLKKRIEELNNQIETTKNSYESTYNEILAYLGVEKSEFSNIESKIDYYNRKISNWNDLSDSELWDAKKNVNQLITEYNQYRESNYSKVPDFRDEFSDLDNKIQNLQSSLSAARPKYYEEKYTVEKGDYLSKISGYSFIYNDPTKWGIIYRANREIIKDPNLIYPNQVLKIPRGLPYKWKVYKGEYLWKIASYPEIYDDGSKWPMIYRANQDKIKDPDLIYPNQILEIPRD